jgi:DNA-directed RNA polymerase subunit K/omega
MSDSEPEDVPVGEVASDQSDADDSDDESFLFEPPPATGDVAIPTVAEEKPWEDDAESKSIGTESIETLDDVVQFDPSEVDELVRQWHPQELVATMKEIRPLLTMHRTEGERVVSDDNHTLTKLTKYEFVKVVGLRKAQLDDGATPFIETDIVDTYSIALEEMRRKVLPFIIVRYLPSSPDRPRRVEYFRLNDLENIYV